MEELRNIPKLPSIGSFRNMSPLAKTEMRNGLLFLSPWIFGFLALTLIPIIATLIFSFMNLKITDGVLSAPQFVGLDNYATLVKDNAVWNFGDGAPGALWVTI